MLSRIWNSANMGRNVSLEWQTTYIHCSLCSNSNRPIKLIMDLRSTYTYGLAILFILCPGLAEMRDQSVRSEEHTSELQSQSNLVCRLLLEKKKKIQIS